MRNPFVRAHLGGRQALFRFALLASLALSPLACQAPEEEPAEAAEAEAPERVLMDEGIYVKMVMMDVLGRAPEQGSYTDPFGQEAVVYDELTLGWTAMGSLSDPRPGRDVLVAGLVAHPDAAIPEKDEVEDPEQWIVSSFQVLLGRNPTDPEMSLLLGEWESDPAVNPRTLTRALLTSWEFGSR